jgi:hypothetical protein
VVRSSLSISRSAKLALSLLKNELNAKQERAASPSHAARRS